MAERLDKCALLYGINHTVQHLHFVQVEYGQKNCNNFLLVFFRSAKIRYRLETYDNKSKTNRTHILTFHIYTYTIYRKPTDISI